MTLIPFLVLTITSFSSSDGIYDASNMGLVFMKTAFAQNTSAGNNNSTDLDSLLKDNSTNFTLPTDNTTNSSTFSITTPEFENIVPIVLVISIISIVIISARTRLRFN